jgi:type II secretory pathway component GspD/PulD (secretin)
VVDGEHAFIHVGESVPFTQEWVVLTRRYVSAQKTTEFVDVTTGFAVHPRSIGNQIELEVTPRIAKLNQGVVIDFEELSTVVLINKGEWLDLGGIMQQKDDVSRAILSKQTGNQEQNNQLMIRVD